MPHNYGAGAGAAGAVYKGPAPAPPAAAYSMFPTAALLLALRLGDCPSGYERRNFVDNVQGMGIETTTCCPDGVDSSSSQCWNADDPCEVANADHQCCGDNEGTKPTSCWNAEREADCRVLDMVDDEWCPLPPAPPAEELSSGAIGGIVVGAYLGVAAIGGAIAAAGYAGHNYGAMG